MFPTQQDNPNGLHQRYIITKADGSPVDPDAEYFVLRLDNKAKDKNHVNACRQAIETYAAIIEDHIPELAKDLLNKYSNTFNRLLNEHHQLSIKIKKLQKFILSDNFATISPVQKEFLKIQLEIMRSYYTVLDARTHW